MGFARFCRAVHLGEAIELYGGGEQVRDFTYVDDVVDANVRVATAEIPPGSVFNVAGGVETSINEVLDLLGDIAGKEVLVKHSGVMPGDATRTGGSTEALHAATGWNPRTALRVGLEEQYRCVAASLA